MRPAALSRSLAFALALLPAACGEAEASEEVSYTVEPGPDAYEILQTALLEAQPGAVISLAPGEYEFRKTLSLEGVEGVTIRGAGMDETVLRYDEQMTGSGGEALRIRADGCVIEDLAIVNTKTDAIKSLGCDGVVYRRVRVEWTGGPSPENGAYGLYPVQSKNILIEDCFVRGASDAGVYVGQSENAIVRRCEVRGNVAGIEIENTNDAEVYDNVATENTGGLLVFVLPELPVKNGRRCKVYRNQIFANNEPNFAPPGNMVAGVPAGSGLVIMAADQVEVFDNTIADNDTCNLSIVSYDVMERPYEDPDFDPYCSAVYVHDNVFEGGGDSPSGPLGLAMAAMLGGGEMPDVVWDGFRPVAGSEDDAFGYPVVKDNGDASFANLDLPGMIAGQQEIERAAPADLPAVPAWPGVELPVGLEAVTGA